MQRRGSKQAVIFVLIALGAVFNGAHADFVLSPPQFDARVEVGIVDNVAQAQLNRDVIDDRLVEANAGVGYGLTVFDGRLDLTGRGFLAGRAQDDVTGLGHWGGGIELGLDGRLTDSALPPFYQVKLRAAGEDYEFKQRDSTIYTGEALVGTNLGVRTTLSAGGGYQRREARSKVFDLTEWSAFIDADVEINPVWSAGLRVIYTDGDVWSSATTVLPNGQPVNDIFDLIAASRVIQRDDALDDAFPGGWFAYRLPATTVEAAASVTRAFGERFAVSIEWIEVRVDARRGIDYDNRVLKLALDVKF